MEYVLARHKVGDFDRWKAIYDRDAEVRRQAGLNEVFVLRSSSDPREVFVLASVDDPICPVNRFGITWQTSARCVSPFAPKSH
jgi:hypothetical protein